MTVPIGLIGAGTGRTVRSGLWAPAGTPGRLTVARVHDGSVETATR